MGNRSLKLVHLLRLLILGGGGFGVGAGCDQGRGHLDGAYLEVPDCQRVGEMTRFEPFRLRLEFLGVNESAGAVTMRMSPKAGRADLADQLGIAFVRSQGLGLATEASTRTFELRADGKGEAELSIVLLERCRNPSAALVAVGTVTFEDWGWQNGERVTGSMAFDVVDKRTGVVVGEGFTGEFDFESLTGAPYTAFSPRNY